MWKLLLQRNFALLWVGGLISMAGDWMLMIARPLFVYELTGSALATSLMFIAGMLPRMVVSPIAGVYVDRWERRRTMIVANLLLALGMLPLVLVKTTDQLWIIYVTALVTSTTARFLHPAENAMLPKLVNESQLVSANALNALNDNLARLIGPPLGGVLFAAFGFQSVVVVEALTFVAAALLISLITVNSKAEQPPDTGEHPLRKVWSEWRDGLRVVRENDTLRLLFMVMTITSVGEGVISVLLVPFATDVLKTDSTGIGLLMSAQGLGGLIGGLMVAWIGARMSEWRMIVIGFFAVGVGDLLLFNYALFFPAYFPALVILLVIGLPISGVFSGMMTLFQKNTGDRYMGRVFSTLTVVMALASLIGMGFAGIAADTFGIVPVINIQAYGYLIATVLIVLTLRRGVVKAVQATAQPLEVKSGAG